MSDLMFEPTGPLQQWQKWANLARLEAIRADEAEELCDTLLAALREALKLCTEIRDWGREGKLRKLIVRELAQTNAALVVEITQAAIAAVEGEQGETA